MPMRQEFNILEILQIFGAVLYPVALSLQMPISLYVLVLERATGVRGHMFAHGLKQVPYCALVKTVFACRC
jgi:hypothetical protein